MMLPEQKNMVLPDLFCIGQRNRIVSESGIDSLSHCLDKKHFKTYPHDIEYRFNSRGFRDQEWPGLVEELQNCIWCFGDSFTKGIGVPYLHTWVKILESKTNKRCINISMDGASNQWIARKIIRVLETVAPKNIVVQWSFLSRFEIEDESLCDEDRRDSGKSSTRTQADLLDQFNKLINQVEIVKNKSNVIHSFIPGYSCATENIDSEIDKIWQSLRGKNWPLSPPLDQRQLMNLDPNILSEITQFNTIDYLIQLLNERVSINQLTNTFNKILHVSEIQPQDLGRDGFHYDIITATEFVSNLLPLIFH